jgi:hypothetical protein
LCKLRTILSDSHSHQSARRAFLFLSADEAHGEVGVKQPEGPAAPLLNP